MSVHMHHTFYISSGRKNAMFTLRHSREANGERYAERFDSYICNLATDEERAAAKATDYFERIRDRFEGNHSSCTLHTDPDCVLFERSGRLSVQDTERMAMIELGKFPFGKHYGTLIADAPDSYLLYFADMQGKENTSAVTEALAMACMGVALERDLIARRDALREERARLDAMSRHVGTVGERIQLTGEVVTCFSKKDDYTGEHMYWVVKLRVDGNLFVYRGSNCLGQRGDILSLSAGIKRHEEYKDVKTTAIQRPTKVTKVS